MRILAVLIAVVVSASAADPPPATLLCTITVDGGIAGMHSVWTVDAVGAISRDGADAGAIDPERVRSGLAAALAAPAQRRDPNVADAMRYSLEVPSPEGSRSVEAWDAGGPHPLLDVVRALRAAVTPAR